MIGEDSNQGKYAYNASSSKAAFGTDATWTTMAGTAKLNNNYSKIDTFKRRQEQLSSNVFGTEDYSHHAPTTKKSGVDVNNQFERQKRNDHNFSDVLPQSDNVINGFTSDDTTPSSNGFHGAEALLHATRSWADADIKKQLKKDYAGYTNIGQKLNELKSTLDTHTYQTDAVKQSDIAASTISQSDVDFNKTAIYCKTPSKATKIRDLSSNLLGQDCSLGKYSTVKDAAQSHSQVVELVVHGLSNEAHADDLMRISGAKHVVEATVDHDAIRNVCTGSGKIKVRLGDGEDIEQVKLSLLKAGFDVNENKVS